MVLNNGLVYTSAERNIRYRRCCSSIFATLASATWSGTFRHLFLHSISCCFLRFCNTRFTWIEVSPMASAISSCVIGNGTHRSCLSFVLACSFMYRLNSRKATFASAGWLAIELSVALQRSEISDAIDPDEISDGLVGGKTLLPTDTAAPLYTVSFLAVEKPVAPA